MLEVTVNREFMWPATKERTNEHTDGVDLYTLNFE